MSLSAGVVVIGGGVAGCGVAWQLAARGADVLLVERANWGAGATRAAAGMLTPEAEADGNSATLALGRAALARWPDFAQALHAASGTDVQFVRSGRIRTSFGAAVEDDAAQAATGTAPHGTRTLSAAEVRALEPALAEDAQAGVFFPDDASVDPRALIDAVAAAAGNTGARLLLDEVVSVDCTSGGVQAVTLRDQGHVATNAVVVAAGAWASALQGVPPTPMIRPVRGDMFAVDVREPLLRHIIWSSDCYLVPRPNGRLLVGATVDDVGFAPGPAVAGIGALAAAAERACPALATLPITETWAGFRPASADGMPVLGADPRVAGLFHAGGLFRNGILLAAAVTEEIALRVLGENGQLDIAAFTPERVGGQ